MRLAEAKLPLSLDEGGGGWGEAFVGAVRPLGEHPTYAWENSPPLAAASPLPPKGPAGPRLCIALPWLGHHPLSFLSAEILGSPSHAQKTLLIFLYLFIYEIFFFCCGQKIKRFVQRFP